MSLWLTVIAAGIATFVIRLSFIGMAGRIAIAPWFERMLRFVPIAALTALVWPDLLLASGAATLGEPRLLAGLAAACVAWQTRNTLLTIAVGMMILWGMQWLQ